MNMNDKIKPPLPHVKLFAPAEYWGLSPDAKRELCNGCGTKGLVGYIVPDTMWGLCVTAACDIHDFMYVMGEDLDDKKEADRVFLNNTLRIIDAAHGCNWIKRLRARRARKYYEAVDHFGGPAFWHGKNCESEMG